MKIEYNSDIVITLNDEELKKLKEELQWFAKTYDYGFETLLEIHDKLKSN